MKKNQSLSFSSILSHIPRSVMLLAEKQTRVNHYCKVLSGELMFHLLLYGLLKRDKLSQRGLKDIFESQMFRISLKLKGKKSISHSSISERLSMMNCDFFKQMYISIYDIFNSLYSDKEIANLSLQRVDSTLVSDVSGKLEKALTNGNSSFKGKMLKFTINFNGMFPSYFKAHNEENYASEVLALTENVMDHFKKEKDHASVYIVDRGQCSAESFKAMSAEDGLHFVGRLQENRRIKVLSSQDVLYSEFAEGELVSDQEVQLYKKVEREGKNGKIVRDSILVDKSFRLIRFKPKGKGKVILLITNIMDLSAQEIADIYRRRWDIEVFFRFIKQELNFSHFLSLSENGIEIMLYMTMITAMLVMIYKRENQLGYRDSIRKINNELEEMILEMLRIEWLRDEYLRKEKTKRRGYITDE
ncbi:IS4 family transposase [Bacteroides sp. 214]|uniref:IS4 family transposase n=1 Tax=Bacteroides sp. 214 TaxID=2302935 RepID=UPI0013D4E6F0|nr:IS4 family transposase [Bacteroides sp. 214]NDW13893.1 IS4 family transposase [Bacteroides sp. 214]